MLIKQQIIKAKKIFFLLLFLGCNNNSVSWYSGTYEEAFNEYNQKIIMVYFYADW
tara:strand:- start:1094 stop:1258 length:165 start_codon:yes stop_codon:yes gene_type:complete